jgi:hypothetical protein
MHITRSLRRARIGAGRRGGFLVGLVAAGALLATVAPAVTPASAAASKLLCHRYQHISVQAPLQATANVQARYWVRNDFWGTDGMCMSNSGQQANFTVTKVGKNKLHGMVMAFPYAFTGCSWGICTKNSGLPAKASTLKNPESSWDITAHAGGVWDASYDLWFSHHRITNGQATGAELMIWLKSSNITIPKGIKKHPLTIDGTKWYFDTWQTVPRGGKSWRYIQFRRVHPTSRVTNLNLGAFVRTAERKGYVQQSWWLMNIEAGFELIHGGVGLATNNFSAHL